jgi:hypothetical protein
VRMRCPGPPEGGPGLRGPTRGGDHDGGDGRGRQERLVPRARRISAELAISGVPAPPRPWPSPRRPAPVRSHPAGQEAASRSSNANCCARTGRWPKRQRCWSCQKKSRRSSTRERTNDRPRRSPGTGPRYPCCAGGRRALAPACAMAGINLRTLQRWKLAKASPAVIAGRRQCALYRPMP